jgi:hypothetical protein
MKKSFCRLTFAVLMCAVFLCGCGEKAESKVASVSSTTVDEVDMEYTFKSEQALIDFIKNNEKMKTEIERNGKITVFKPESVPDRYEFDKITAISYGYYIKYNYRFNEYNKEGYTLEEIDNAIQPSFTWFHNCSGEESLKGFAESNELTKADIMDGYYYKRSYIEDKNVTVFWFAWENSEGVFYVSMPLKGNVSLKQFAENPAVKGFIKEKSVTE